VERLARRQPVINRRLLAQVDDRVRVAHQKVPGVAIVDRQEAPEQPVERVLAGHHLNLRTSFRQLVAHGFGTVSST
jgi:hypothetical protein